MGARWIVKAAGRHAHSEIGPTVSGGGTRRVRVGMCTGRQIHGSTMVSPNSKVVMT